ncbi:MAG: hypothetical protein HY911_04575 [Desulfobacterales bacterium]|nr:hypothetical protein [Desulfobacterales bacterium]
MKRALAYLLFCTLLMQFYGHASAAQLLFDGYENGDLSNWNVQFPAEHTIVTSPVHSGTYAHRASGTGGIVWRNFGTTTTGKLFIRFYWWRSSGAGYISKFARLHPIDNAGDLHLEMWGNDGAPGVVWYYGGDYPGCGLGELAGSGSGAYPGVSMTQPEHWYKYEMFIESNTVGQANGRHRLWIDRPEGSFGSAGLITDTQGAVFKTASCNLDWGSIQLPTGYNDVAGFFVFDDFEAWDDLPGSEPTPTPTPTTTPTPAPTPAPTPTGVVSHAVQKAGAVHVQQTDGAAKWAH